MSWTAEDIPAYQFNGSFRRPMSDETAAMSAPNALVSGVTEREARSALIFHLIKNRAYAMRTPTRAGEAAWYDAAVAFVETGQNMVHVDGRGYRIRDESACEEWPGGKHTSYTNCPNCLPTRYPIQIWSD